MFGLRLGTEGAEGELALLRLGIVHLIPALLSETVLIAAVLILHIAIVALFQNPSIHNAVATSFSDAVVAAVVYEGVRIVALFGKLSDGVAARAIH
jgi:hypothetical protein